MKIIDDINQLDLSNYINSGDFITWGQALAEPLALTENLIKNRHKIGKIKAFIGISLFQTCQPEYTDYIEYISYCGSSNNRNLAKLKLLNILPCHYSQIPNLIQTRQLPIDIVLIQISEPNTNGYYSYGLAQDYLTSAIKNARLVIAEINKQIPWTESDHYLTEADIDIAVYTNRPIKSQKNDECSKVVDKITQLIATNIQDGDTLQLGIGTIPEALTHNVLKNHKNLGIHSGVISDNVAMLIQSGIVTNQYKSIDKGISIAGLILGSSNLLKYISQNKDIALRPTEYTHNTAILSSIHQFVAINSAIEVDLTGQVNSEIANGVYIGAVGGALDFIRAANSSPGGKSIIALPSTGKNFSRIVAQLSGPVTIPRSDVGLIITEYGVADLRGLTIYERIDRMISIAHPSFRYDLQNSTSIII